MATGTTDLLTAGTIAKTLSLPDAKVKKAIQTLGIKPAAKKGVCNYYATDAVAKIRNAVK